jgi:hypothetical protein
MTLPHSDFRDSFRGQARQQEHSRTWQNSILSLSKVKGEVFGLILPKESRAKDARHYLPPEVLESEDSTATCTKTTPVLSICNNIYTGVYTYNTVR